MSKEVKIIVSACLAGEKCRFNGTTKRLARLDDYVGGVRVLAVCPEIEGGFGVPRPRAAIDCGTGRDVLEGKARVVTEQGEDVTAGYIAGARKALDLARKYHVRKAVLKSKSPSCGYGSIYNCDKHTSAYRLVKGNGVMAELFLRNGIEVIAV